MEHTNGWQVGISRILHGGMDPGDYSPVVEREEADAAAQASGCSVEEAIDAENGVWMVTVSQAILDELLHDGEWAGDQGGYYLDIDAGDQGEGEGEVEHE